MATTKRSPVKPSTEYDGYFMAGNDAFKEGRYEKSLEHYQKCLAATDDRSALAATHTAMAKALTKLRQPVEATMALKKATTANPEYLPAIRLLAAYFEAQGDFVQAQQWLTMALKLALQPKHGVSNDDISDFKRRLAHALEITQKGLPQRMRNKEAYEDCRRARFDVGRLNVQYLTRGLRPGDVYFVLPATWWDQWKAFVGGYEDSKDVVAWQRLYKAHGRLDFQPDDAVVRVLWKTLNIEQHLPPAASALQGNGTDSGAGAPGTGSPGPIDTRTVLDAVPEPVNGVYVDSDGNKRGPRLKPGLQELADVILVGTEVWELLQLAYGTVGPAIRRYVVPRIANSATDVLVDLYPENGRYPQAADYDEELGSDDMADVTAGVAAMSTVERPPQDAELEPESTADETGAGDAAVLAPLHRCAVCDAPAASRCPRCRVARYCSADCQQAAWGEMHKKTCSAWADKQKGSALPLQVIERNGKVGLSNLGNTCFMNSSLQALSSVWPLTRYFITGRWEPQLNVTNSMGSKGLIARAYAGLMKRMWLSEASAVSPSEFKSSIARFQSRFSGFQQHDAQELLNYLLDGLHEDLNGIKQKPWVEDEESKGRPDALVAALSWEKYCRRNQSKLLDLFAAQLKSTLVCPKCEQVSVKFDPYWTVPLPIPPEHDRSGPQALEFMLSRMTWEPSDASKIALPSAGTEAQWEQAREVRAPRPAGASEDDEDGNSLPAGAGAVFNKPHRVERYMVKADGPRVSVAKLLQAMSAVTGIKPECLQLQVVGSETAGVFAKSYHTPDQELELAVFTAQRGRVRTLQPTAFLHAVELPPPDWVLPEQQTCKEALQAWPGAQAEAEAVEASREAAGTDLKQSAAADKALCAARHPGKRLAVLTRVSVFKGTNSVHGVPTKDPMGPDVIQRSAPGPTWDQHHVEILPLILPAAAGMSVTALRLAYARELYSQLSPAAKHILAQHAGAGASEGEVEVTDTQALLYIASQLHIAALGGKGKEPCWLPWITADGEDARPEPGAIPGLELPASTTPISHFATLDVLREGVGSRVHRDETMVWTRLQVYIRGELARLAYATGVRHRLQLPLAEQHSLYTPSWHAVHKEQEEEEEYGASSGVKLDACFERLRREEVLDKDNMWYCGKCKDHVQASKKLELWSLPDFLVLQLKRFETRGYRTNKVETMVNFPLRALDLSPYHAAQQPENVAFDPREHAPDGVVLPEPTAAHPDNSLYDCVAVINHAGGPYGGHYYAYGNHDVGMAGGAEAAGQWFEFNDSHVSRMDPQRVATRGAYVLVYRRRRQAGRPL